MRITEPRISALPPDQWDEKAKAVLGNFPPLNLFKTMANHPALAQRWLAFASYMLFESTLSPRERELVILRVAHRCRSEYEWGQHVVIARQAKISDDDIRACAADLDAGSWTPAERLLLQATDELHADSHVSDATWQGLASHFSTQQLMDLVFMVGQYVLVAMALNSFGVQPEPSLPKFDLSSR